MVLTSLQLQAPTQGENGCPITEDDAYSSEDSESSEINHISSSSVSSDEDCFSEFRFEESKSDADITQTQDIIEQRWLSHEYCDFLSDFGRCEPFLLDGDALMMYALSNKYLDWRNGGQFLHLIYVVEQFLALLWSRGANFDIFFLMDNEVIFEHIGPSYQLGRNVLIHHLYSCESRANYQLKLHLISGSWFSANNTASTEWQNLVTSYRPVFIMTNNERGGPTFSSIGQRWFCHQQLLDGYYVVVLENIDFEGSRVKGFLYNYPDPKTSLKIEEKLTVLKAHLNKVYGVVVPNGGLFKGSSDARDWRDLPGEGATLSRTSLFIESLRTILTSDSCSPETKGLAAVGCACFEAIRSQPLAARVLVLPGDDKLVAALEAWGGSAAVARTASAFLNKLYSSMAAMVRRAIAQGAQVDGGSLADAFDGRLFAALLLHTIASGGSLPDGLAEASRLLLLSSWPVGAGHCPSLAELLRPSAADADAARIALARAAALRDTLQRTEPATLLPAGGTLLKEVLGELAGRMATHETAEPPQASGAGPFRAHHYHSTRPLEDEPDSFSYSLWDADQGHAVRRDLFWVRKQERRRLKQLQLKARAATRYQESLLAGSPCQRQTISQKLSQDELEEKRRRAVEALRADGGLGQARGGEGRERGGNKAPSRAEKPRSAKAQVSKKDKIIQDNVAAQRRKKFEAEMKGFECYKNQESKVRDRDVDVYLAKMEELAGRSEEIALQVRLHCLETAARGCSAARRQKTVFLIAQRILRQHLPQLESADRSSVASAVRSVGFADLHDALLGPESKPRPRPEATVQSSVRFQLERAPEYLARPAGDGRDPRVQFPPDTWQRRLLNVVDSGNSALVVAPTASGKTFISYYVMEMCLRAGDDDVVVYVAPTKALVNQVRAEIDARFDKCYRGSRKVSATFTRDFRDENMLAAQILVTVPACLGILLLSNAEWSSRIRHVIFDEVHCLGDSGGEVWEQLILLIDCPFLALSATLGNVQHFHAWLSKVEATRGREVVLVEHHERYNDLSPWLWGERGLVPLNPCWVLHKVRMGRRIVPEMFPKDLRLLPEHCTALYDAMTPHMPREAVCALDPEVFFRSLNPDSEVLWGLSMRQAAAWEAALKRALCQLEPEAQDAVLERLSAETSATFEASDGELARVGEGPYVKKQITALIQRLKNMDMLPCICFLLDRQGCERLASLVTKELQDQEAERRETNGWGAKRDRLRAELDEAIQRYKKCREADLILSTGEIISARSDLYNRCCELKQLLRRHVQPEAEFSVSIVSDEEIEDAFGKLRDGEHWSDLVRPGLRAALRRGIGVHHAGMPLKYRQAVERLFRAKRLGTVFATATLALGINMPAKTSVFVRDAVYLNAMNFRQMAGRAGRRGFDLRGHVVFVGMPSTKCFRLMRSDLPKLQGNLVLSNSMALRLIIRQSALARLRTRDDGPYRRGIRSCWRLVNLPLFDPLAASAAGLMGRQMAHAFRFSVEYLQRAGLVNIDAAGETVPNDLAAFVSHLFFMEPSNFAFVSLLVADDGALFRRLCRPHPQRDEKVLSVLCHLFGRKLLPKSLAEWASCRDSSSGPSVVLLPALSSIGDLARVTGSSELGQEGELVRRLLQQHNDDALRSLEAYCECFAAAHADQLGEDDVLPATGCRLGPTIAGAASGLGPELERLAMRPQVRSAFVALSGHGDRFRSVRELCATLRAGLYLDPQIVPVFELLDSAVPLNAFLLDFFKHGQLEALVRYNRIRRDALWDELQSFALVLKALHAAMARRAIQARCSGHTTPFADADVLATLESISRRFNQLLHDAGA